MELIDRQALRERLGIAEECKDCEHNSMESFCGNMMHFYYACEAIDEMPTIDAVPVIRCKDCKWWDAKDNSSYGYCMAMKHGYFSSNWEIGIYRTYKGDWFCADGERKEE